MSEQPEIDKENAAKKEEKPEETANLELMAQKSIRDLPKMQVSEDEKGEKLSACTDNEWDASDEPFSAELLNVKNSPNRVSVFSGPYRSKETYQNVTKKGATPPPAAVPEVDDRADRLAKMMGTVFNELVGGRDLARIKVTISTKL